MQPALYLVAARAAFENDANWLEALENVARAAARRPGLVAALQVRMHDAPAARRETIVPAARLERESQLAAQALRRIRRCDPDRSLRVLLNHPYLDAIGLGYDGLHWREGAIPLDQDALAATHFVSASVHALVSLNRAEAAGARLVLFGPIWDSSWKASQPLGLGELRAFARATWLPVFAIGGVTPERARDCMRVGAAGVAAVSAVFHSRDPAAALDAFSAAIGAGGPGSARSRHGSARGDTASPESA